MFLQPLPEIEHFIISLNEQLQTLNDKGLTKCQRLWLNLVLTGIAVTGQLCWAIFERRDCFGRVTQDSLRWMFRHSELAWNRLLECSIRALLSKYDLTKGVLVIDDTERNRSKRTTKIYGVHTCKDKKSAGYIPAQSIVFLVLVTPLLTIPVGAKFYIPDPKQKEWKKIQAQEKQAKLPKKQRTPQPARDAQYSTKQGLALNLVQEFITAFPAVKINAVLADALYGSSEFIQKASEVEGITQVVSQLRSNQIVFSRGREVSLKDYFNRQSGVETTVRVRGGPDQRVTILAARLKVRAHEKRRFVVAIQYEGESEYRFLVASNLSWRHTDIAKLYTLRWLVEVFIEDWKQHGGWNAAAKHQGEDGSVHGLILSLLYDHALLFHHEQFIRLKNKQPGLTAGCLTERLKVSATIATVEEIVKDDNPVDKFEQMAFILRQRTPSRPSTKHMAGRDLGQQHGQDSLKYRRDKADRMAA